MQKFKYFTDKRVDKICLEKGITDYEVFYSPIKAFIESFAFFLFIIFQISVTFIPFTNHSISIIFTNLTFFALFPLYLIFSFLLFSKLSHSFVVTANQIIIINPNFFFKKYEVFEYNEIKKIEIASSNTFIYNFFLIFNQSYVAIETQNEYKRFYCTGLDVTGYEDYDNLTEKTLDDLHSSLKKKGIETKLHI